MQNNFRCSKEECKKEFFIQRSVFLPSTGLYYDNLKNKAPLRCDACFCCLEPIEVKNLQVGLNVGKFSSASPAQKKEILRKRSLEHSKKHVPTPKDI